eukprot:gene8447-11425_t
MSTRINLDALIAKFDDIEIEENRSWVELHEKIVEYRKNNSLTISDFLKASGLNYHKSYFKQLACNTGYKLSPSKTEGSTGREFTDAVCEFFKNDVKTTFFEDSLSVLIEDWVLDNHDKLETMKILSIDFLDSKINIHVLDGCVISNEEIFQLMSDDGINVAFEEITSVGTGTTVLFKGRIITLTAKHVCHTYTGEVESLEEINPLTGKYLLASPTEVFGFIVNRFKCPHIDFAFVCPFSDRMLHISYTNSLSRRIIISKWWNDSWPNSLEYIRGRPLIKDGWTDNWINFRGGFPKCVILHSWQRIVSICCGWRFWITNWCVFKKQWKLLVWLS